MPLDYRVIEIHTSEEARHRHRPLADAVVDLVKELKIAARCSVFRGREGVYESGETASLHLMDISYNLPIKIEILLPAAEAEAVMDRLETMVEDGVIGVRELSVRAYRTRHHLIPRQVRVKDIMTVDPVCFPPGTPLDQVAKSLLGAVFGGVPIVDAARRPVGIVTQGDLIYKAKMPLRIGLIAASEPERRDAVMAELAALKAQDVMTRQPVCVGEGERVTDVVDLMVKRGLKRLPVVDADGLLAGMLSRLDVFRTIAREAPDWSALTRGAVAVENLRYVSDIMRRDTQTVGPGEPVEEVIRRIVADDIQCMAVVDDAGIFLGLISDRQLLNAFSGRGLGFWNYLACRIGARGPVACSGELGRTLQERTAAEVMETDLVIVGESTSVEEAVKLMVGRRLKRLPVVDAQGRFRGMISREALLKTGHGEGDG